MNREQTIGPEVFEFEPEAPVESPDAPRPPAFGKSFNFEGDDSLLSDTPVPGRFYRIKHDAGGLLTTAGRAYGLKEGAERLKRAQEINDHPLNRKFWRAPENGFERKYFMKGIISFSPRFACDGGQAGSKAAAGRCFATIWIPPNEKVRHPQLGYGVAWPAAILRTNAARSSLIPEFPLFPTVDICDALDECFSGLERKDINIRGLTDDRELVSNTSLAPHRWICHIVALYQSSILPGFVFSFGAGTGSLVGEKHILTAAHILHDRVEMKDGNVAIPLTAAAMVVVPAREGPLTNYIVRSEAVRSKFSRFSPFGAFVVRGNGTIKLPKEWKALVRRTRDTRRMNRKFDYALIDLTGAVPCNSVYPLLKPWPDGYWGASGTATIVSAQIKNFAYAMIRKLELSISGYPGDKPCSQWISRGTAKAIQEIVTSKHNVITHEIDNAAGMSGSPVWVRMIVKGTDTLVLIGIHTGDNGATAITRTVWKRITEWLNPTPAGFP